MRNLFKTTAWGTILLTILLMNLTTSITFAADPIRLDGVLGLAEVQVKRGSQTLSVRVGDSLQARDQFSTGPSQSVKLLFPDGSVLLVAPLSSVQVNSTQTEDGHRI